MLSVFAVLFPPGFGLLPITSHSACSSCYHWLLSAYDDED